jgi:hypothetical protein
VVKDDWQMPLAQTRIPGKPVQAKTAGSRDQNRLVLQLKPDKSDKRGRERPVKSTAPGSYLSLAHAREVPQKASFKRLP